MSASPAVVTKLSADYADWTAKRRALSAQEESGPTPDPDDWAASDDEAVELLKAAMALIAEARLIDRLSDIADNYEVGISQAHGVYTVTINEGLAFGASTLREAIEAAVSDFDSPENAEDWND